MGHSLKCSFIILIIMLMLPVYSPLAAVMYPDRPMLPNDQLQKETMIIVVDERSFSKAKRMLKERYPDIEIRQQYQTAFYGFSVEGRKRDLQSLLNEPFILHASPVSTYEPNIEESVPFIGGERIRGYFNEKGERLTGKGIKIAVIDTGIDYHHPDLRRNYKGGYDFVDGDRHPMEATEKNGATIHGTHVAGIIAANGKLTGMSPDASIIVYRALGPNGYGTSEQVISAIEQAIIDQVDIINLSLGNRVNSPDWPTSLALNQAVKKGIIAVVSSGNSGPKTWTVGSPGTASKAISVGASTPPIEVPYVTLSGYHKQIPILPMHGSAKWDLEGTENIVYAKLGEDVDFPKNVRGKIVLVKRGKLSFTEKALNAEKKGAKALLIYNNVSGNFAGQLEREVHIPVASISKKDGEWLRKHIDNKAWLKTVYQKEEDTLAEFSSRGPVTTTWEIKPDVVAPGVEIDSTIPNGYLALNGTSMAAPHVAGACALIKQAHPDWNPVQVKAALMNTAKPITRRDGKPLRSYEQGAGRIDVVKAIQTNVLIYPSSITFGQIYSTEPRMQKQVRLTLDNQSENERKFTFLQPEHRNGIQWKLPKTVQVPPKQKRNVVISVDMTPSLFKNGIYDGYVHVQSGEQTIRIPYLFVVNEPDYPRLMGFEFGLADAENTFHYELYLPGGAEEFGIALYDPDTLRFISFLDWQRNVPRGLREKNVNIKTLNVPKGIYKAVIFAKKGKKEDKIETELSLNPEILKNE
ncbi:S8 family serine peptidase [Aeribacillus alveayuensis]|uniref:Minor extracellular serine protease Vpr n=1 Tax=Aeribacillus alveayuensis TaxID=279215 RepID=A0ABT9VNR0_9BACI|nr:minor extracellular serine protease Vpr [Bacillus alveayuensis]